MAYVCEVLDVTTGVCSSWVVYQQTWLEQLNSLSKADIDYLIRNITGFWLVCSLYRELLKFIGSK